jgi:hypothetical protein
MNTLEDRLRAALTAKSDGVAFSMLTRSAPPLEPAMADSPPVLLIAPPHRPRRSRRTLATAVAVAAVLLIAVGAVVLHRATTPRTVGPAQVRPRSAIPWDRVGPGWTLQVDRPGTVEVPGGVAGWLYLIDPHGQAYRICQVPDVYGFDVIPAWGKPFNTDRMIMESIVGEGQSSLLEINLRSGAQHSVKVQVPGAWHIAEFVNDTSILLNNVNKMIKVSAATGRTETSFEGSEFFGSLISPDRKHVVSGTSTDIAVRDIATGRITRRLAFPSGYRACIPNSWPPTATSFAARCQQIKSAGSLTFTFSVNGTAGPKPPEVPAGWDELHLATADIAIRSSKPSLDGMAFARISPSNELEPIAVPGELKGTGWVLASVTPTGFIVEHAAPGGDSTDAVVSWNPLTGQVDHLFPDVKTGSPRGGWAGWDTTLF